MNINFPTCGECGELYIDKSIIDYLCFLCWRKHKVYRELEKWFSENPKCKPDYNDSIQIKLQKETLVMIKMQQFENELQPPVLDLTPYNLERAKLDCEVKRMNAERSNDNIADQDNEIKDNVLPFLPTTKEK